MDCQLVCLPKNCPRGWDENSGLNSNFNCFKCECFEQIDAIHHITGEGVFTCTIEDKYAEENEVEE